MNKNIKYAIAWAGMGLVYLSIGALNFWMHQAVRGAVISVVGYLISAMFIFKCSGQYGAWKLVDAVCRVAESKQWEPPTQPIWDLNEETARQIQCRKCGYTEFIQVAGRYVCACCGEVMENHEEGPVR